MPRVCTVCQHPDRAAIDQALVSGTPIPRIAALHRVSEDALARHKTGHLPATVREGQALAAAAHADALTQQQAAQQQAGDQQALDVVTQLKEINEATRTILQEAREQKNYDLALRAVDRAQRQI